MPTNYAPAPTSTLKGLRDAAQAKFGDYVLDVSDAEDGSDLIVLRHPLRLDDKVRASLQDIGDRISKVQEDAPEVAEARKKLNAAVNRRQSAEGEGKEPSEAVLARLDARVEEELAKVEAAEAEFNPTEDQRLAAVRDVVVGMIRDTARTPDEAERLILILGDDTTQHIVLVEQYTRRGQLGEA